jgi:transposase
VRRVQQRYRAVGEMVLLGVPTGGRRHENLSLGEERSFLQTFAGSAAAGQLLEVSQVKVAYEERVGHRVPHSTIYRLLARHGWRKLMPRRRHPESDAEAQAGFKKNGRRSWDKPAPRLRPSNARCG